MPDYQTIFVPSSKVSRLRELGDQHLVIVAGGMSAERQVSSSSAVSVIKALMATNYQLTLVDMGADLAQILSNLKPDIVFNCLHGTYGEDGCLPGLLNIMRIPYTHSGVLASALAFNKLKSQQLFAASGLSVPESIIVNKSQPRLSDPAARPYVIKPLSQGSSIGVEVIFAEDHFNFQDYQFPYGEAVMVEEYIQGPELMVAVLNGQALGIMQVKPLKRRFYDYDSKYTPGLTQYQLPARLPALITARLMAAAEQAYNALGCRGPARAEFIYNSANQELVILEVNTHPGLTLLSSYPAIADYYGINMTNLCLELLKTATFEL